MHWLKYDRFIWRGHWRVTARTPHHLKPSLVHNTERNLGAEYAMMLLVRTTPTLEINQSK